eukprot:512607-Prorocentrum_minimum.AAC.3
MSAAMMNASKLVMPTKGAAQRNTRTAAVKAPAMPKMLTAIPCFFKRPGALHTIIFIVFIVFYGRTLICPSHILSSVVYSLVVLPGARGSLRVRGPAPVHPSAPPYGQRSPRAVGERCRRGGQGWAPEGAQTLAMLNAQ